MTEVELLRAHSAILEMIARGVDLPRILEAVSRTVETRLGPGARVATELGAAEKLPAGVDGVLTTPIIGAAAQVLGEMRVMNASQWRPDDAELQFLELMARTVGIAADRRAADDELSSSAR